MKPPKRALLAREPSAIARVFEFWNKGKRGYRYYTTSHGGTDWDYRAFKTRSAAVRAALDAGFVVPLDEIRNGPKGEGDDGGRR